MNRPDVRALFDRIAPLYDAMNDRISYGRQRAWKKRLTRDASRIGGDALDLCCGTGDIALSLAACGTFASVTGVDFSEGMLRIAKERAAQTCVTFICHDAGSTLPFSDACFNVASVSFGLRNLPDPAAALTELLRVLRPGGRLYVLDACRAVGPLARLAYWIQYRILFPVMTRNNRVDYDWLRRSSEGFWSLSELSTAAADIGFTVLHRRHYACGLAMCAELAKESA